jgi:hypothetical protein
MANEEGGWGDFITSFDDLDEAEKIAERLNGHDEGIAERYIDWWEIVDLHSFRVVRQHCIYGETA